MKNRCSAYCTVLKVTELTAPVAEMDALEPAASVVVAANVIVPVLLTIPLLVAVCVMGPIVVEVGIVESAILVTDTEATAPVADEDTEDPIPRLAPTVMLPEFVTVGATVASVELPFIAVWVTEPNVPLVAFSLLVLIDNDETAPVAPIDAEAPCPIVPTVTLAVELVTFISFVADWVIVPNVGTANDPAVEVPEVVKESSVRPDTETEATAPLALTDAEAPSPILPALSTPELVITLVLSVLVTVCVTVPNVAVVRFAFTIETLIEPTAPVALIDADAPSANVPTSKAFEEVVSATPTLFTSPVLLITCLMLPTAEPVKSAGAIESVATDTPRMLTEPTAPVAPIETEAPRPRLPVVTVA